MPFEALTLFAGTGILSLHLLQRTRTKRAREIPSETIFYNLTLMPCLLEQAQLTQYLHITHC